MRKHVNLTYVIRNNADLTFYRTENQMTNLVALYRKFDTLGLDPGPIRDVQYVTCPRGDVDDVLNIDGIWDGFLSDLENVHDLDSEHRPMMKYVVMKCQRIPQISKASL